MSRSRSLLKKKGLDIEFLALGKALVLELRLFQNVKREKDHCLIF